MSLDAQHGGLRARVLTSIANDPAPVRASVSKRTALALLAGAAGAGVFAATGRHDAAPDARWIGGPAILLIAAAAATMLALGGRAAGWSRAVRTIAVAIAVAAAGVLASGLWAADPFGDLPARVHVACTVMTAGLGAVLALLFAFARRGTEAVTPARAGLALGGLLGLWSAGLVAVRCGHAEIDHLLGAHLAPVAIVAIAGIALGRRLMTPRPVLTPRSRIDVP